MRPLSDHTPKPMLPVQGKPLMQWAMASMQRAGVQDLVVNTAWLGEQIPKHFGNCFDGPQQVTPSENKPMQMHYSQEGEALETAGGIIRALPMLADVFWVAAGDVWMPEFSFAREAYASFKASNQLAHIWLVPNPAHNPRGDFGIDFDTTGRADGFAQSATSSCEVPVPNHGLALNLPNNSAAPRWTFSTVALYKQAFFQSAWCDIPAGNPDGVKAPLAPMLRAAMDHGLVGATLYEQAWSDVGTPERLAEINNGTLR